MVTPDQAREALKKHGSQTAAAKALGVARSTLAKHLNVEAKPQQPKAGRSIDEFRNTYDKSTIVPKRVSAALKQLGGGWDYEVNFARLAGVSLMDLSAIRDQFEAHVVPVDRSGRRAWAGTTATAQKMREMIGVKP